MEHQVDENSPIVFINDITPVDNNADKVTPKSTLSDADKVVGSNKPSLKSQSSLGSYSSSVDTNTEEPIIELNVSETFQPPVENEVSNFKNHFSIIHLNNTDRYKLSVLKKTHPGIIYLGGFYYKETIIIEKGAEVLGEDFPRYFL